MREQLGSPTQTEVAIGNAMNSAHHLAGELLHDSTPTNQAKLLPELQAEILKFFKNFRLASPSAYPDYSTWAENAKNLEEISRKYNLKTE